MSRINPLSRPIQVQRYHEAGIDSHDSLLREAP